MMDYNSHKTYGFKNTYGIDLGETVRWYSEDPGDYEENGCYKNAFHLCDNGMLKSGYKVNAVFGYVLSSNSERKVAVRHAWNVFKTPMADIPVDVTMMANGENLVSVLGYTYLPIDEYTPTQFLDEIDKNDGKCGLPETKKEKRFIQELTKKGFEVFS